MSSKPEPEGKSGTASSSCSIGVVDCSRFGAIGGSSGNTIRRLVLVPPLFFVRVFLQKNQLSTRRVCVGEIAHDRLNLIEELTKVLPGRNFGDALLPRGRAMW